MVVSYWSSIDTMSLSPTVAENIKRHNLDNCIPIVNTLENNLGDLGAGIADCATCQ